MGEFRNLENMLRAHGRARPDAIMADYDGQTATYGEMDLRTNRIANALAAEGIGKDDRIALIDKNGLALFETLFGARKAGAVQIAVNWRLSAEEMAYVLADSESRIVFVSSEFLNGLKDECAARGIAPRFIVLDGPQADYESWYSSHSDADAMNSSAPDDVALQLYTSGTTGRPKGAMLMNRSIFAFFDAAGDIFGRDPDFRHLNCLPLFHVGGINWSLQAMAYGSQVMGFRDFDPLQVIESIPERQATHLMTVPAVIQILLEHPAARTTDFSSLQGICYGGSIIPVHVLTDAVETFGCGLYGMYGSTELSFGNTLLSPADHDPVNTPHLLTSCGRPFPGTGMRIVDPATLKDVAPGETGEIWMQSPQVAKAYWKQPEASAETFLPGGWYRTGDIGKLVDGYLYISDRLNDMIISGGENVYPAEVERVLNAHQDVRETAAFAIPHPRWGEAVACAVRLEDEAEVGETALIEWCRDRLAHYKCPSKVIVMDDFPRTPSGKVQRTVLRAPFWPSN